MNNPDRIQARITVALVMDGAVIASASETLATDKVVQGPLTRIDDLHVHRLMKRATEAAQRRFGGPSKAKQ